MSVVKDGQTQDSVNVPPVFLVQGVKALPIPLLIPAPYLDGPITGTRCELPAAKGDQASNPVSMTTARLIQGVKALPLLLLILAPYLDDSDQGGIRHSLCRKASLLFINVWV